MKAVEKSPFETTENMWAALTYSRQWRLGLQRAESDAESGTVRIVNEDALPPEG